MANSTSVIQHYGPDSQFTHPHLYLPQFDWGSNEEPPLLYGNPATIPVSIINNLVYQRSTDVSELTIR
jgi:hypothetical protein